MSQRLLDTLIKEQCRGGLCPQGRQWIGGLPDNISAQEAYEQCPNWTWIDFITGWAISEDSEYRPLIDSLKTESKLYVSLGSDHYECAHLPKELNDKFKQIYPFRKFSADFPTIVKLFNQCENIRPQETDKTESRGISDSGVTF